MAEYGVAKGGPHSDTRKKQAQTLWRVHFPALHIHISRGDKERWMNWVHALNEGVSLFASAMRRVGMSNHHPLWNCLRPFMPADSTADWLQDDENSTSACLKWGAAMKLHLPHDHFFSTNQKRRIAIRWHSVDMTLYAYIPVNHKRIVTLSATHPLLIRWKDGDNNVDVALRFKDKVDAQRDSICQYRIIFEKNDIYLYKDHDQQPAFRFTNEDVDADPAVRRLWKHEMLERAYVIDDEKQREPMSIGVPAFTAVTKVHNRQTSINRNDTALWLL